MLCMCCRIAMRTAKWWKPCDLPWLTSLFATLWVTGADVFLLVEGNVLRSPPFVTDTAVCQPAFSATAWRGQGLFQYVLEAAAVRSVCEPRLAYACSDIVYVEETTVYTETKVFSGGHMHGQVKMAKKQQYALCKMHTAAVLSHEWVNCHELRTLKPRFASCMIHNASHKWLCSGERSPLHMEWNYLDLQSLLVLACTCIHPHPLAFVMLTSAYRSMNCKHTNTLACVCAAMWSIMPAWECITPLIKEWSATIPVRGQSNSAQITDYMGDNSAIQCTGQTTSATEWISHSTVYITPATGWCITRNRNTQNYTEYRDKGDEILRRRKVQTYHNGLWQSTAALEKRRVANVLVGTI